LAEDLQVDIMEVEYRILAWRLHYTNRQRDDQYTKTFSFDDNNQ